MLIIAHSFQLCRQHPASYAISSDSGPNLFKCDILVAPMPGQDSTEQTEWPLQQSTRLTRTWPADKAQRMARAACPLSVWPDPICAQRLAWASLIVHL